MGGVNRLSASFESRGHCRRMANHVVMISELKIRKSYHWISAVLPAAINGDNRRHFRSEVILYRHIYWLEIIAWAVLWNQKLHSKARSFLSFESNQGRLLLFLAPSRTLFLQDYAFLRSHPGEDGNKPLPESRIIPENTGRKGSDLIRKGTSAQNA